MKLINKTGHRASIKRNGRYLTMATYNGLRGLKLGKFLTGVRTDVLDTPRMAEIEYRKLVKVMLSNGYKLSK